MRTVMSLVLCGLMMTAAMVMSGCAAASIDRGAAKAQTGAPEVARVEPISIPYDANCPKYIVAVEPFSYSASDTVSGKDVSSHVGDVTRQNIGPGLSAQLMTALSKSLNIEVVELDALKKGSDGTYSTKLGAGEVGPFIVRGVVTEFNETADASGKGKSVNAGFIGWIMGLVGLATDSKALTYTGAGVAVANPQYENKSMKRSGMVGMDIRIVNGQNNRIAGSFASAGTFTTVSAKSGVSVFGIGKNNEEFAASALGQATRAAMNDAVKQSTDLLKGKFPKK